LHVLDKRPRGFETLRRSLETLYLLNMTLCLMTIPAFTDRLLTMCGRFTLTVLKGMAAVQILVWLIQFAILALPWYERPIAALLIGILLLRGGIESNPGPSSRTPWGDDGFEVCSFSSLRCLHVYLFRDPPMTE
jgi:hypothetical protein